MTLQRGTALPQEGKMTGNTLGRSQTQHMELKNQTLESTYCVIPSV